MTEFRRYWMIPLFLLLGFVFLNGCESCEETKAVRALSLPFQDNFDRPTLGDAWYTERPGRWNIKYDTRSQKGQLCVWQARNMPLFLKKGLPRDVVIEFDAWAYHKEGDVKVELFTDGKFHATGYVLVHGGWNNKWSIIDRLDEHNTNCKYDRKTKRHQNNIRMNCRKIKRGGPLQKRKYHWKIVRAGDTVSWYLNNQLHLKYIDPMPLTGKSHRHFAFSNWIARVCFDNLSIKAYQNSRVLAPKAPASPVPLRATQIPTAPLPRAVGTSPAPLQPNIPPPPQPLVPKVTRLPQPHSLKLRGPAKLPKLRVYRPQLYRQPGVPSRSIPTLYRKPTLRIKKR